MVCRSRDDWTEQFYDCCNLKVPAKATNIYCEGCAAFYQAVIGDHEKKVVVKCSKCRRKTCPTALKQWNSCRRCELDSAPSNEQADMIRSAAFKLIEVLSKQVELGALDNLPSHILLPGLKSVHNAWDNMVSSEPSPKYRMMIPAIVAVVAILILTLLQFYFNK